MIRIETLFDFDDWNNLEQRIIVWYCFISWQLNTDHAWEILIWPKLFVSENWNWTWRWLILKNCWFQIYEQLNELSSKRWIKNNNRNENRRPNWWISSFRKLNLFREALPVERENITFSRQKSGFDSQVMHLSSFFCLLSFAFSIFGIISMLQFLKFESVSRNTVSKREEQCFAKARIRVRVQHNTSWILLFSSFVFRFRISEMISIHSVIHSNFWDIDQIVKPGIQQLSICFNILSRLITFQSSFLIIQRVSDQIQMVCILNWIMNWRMAKYKNKKTRTNWSEEHIVKNKGNWGNGRAYLGQR
jgi:hypothetical protein